MSINATSNVLNDAAMVRQQAEQKVFDSINARAVQILNETVSDYHEGESCRRILVCRIPYLLANDEFRKKVQDYVISIFTNLNGFSMHICTTATERDIYFHTGHLQIEKFPFVDGVSSLDCKNKIIAKLS